MSERANNSVILVRPPSSMGAAHAHALQHPVGLCLLAAGLRDAGFAPEILDYEVNEYRAARFAEHIRRARPLAVGVTAMTPVIGHAFEMARIVKRERPEARVLLGGAHASILPLRSLEECPSADAACTGEGESKITDLCRAAAHGEWDTLELPGAVLRASDGTLRDFTAAPCEHLDLDALPMPARDLLDFGKYLGASTPGIPAGKYRSTQLFTSRGCPGKCIFCCSDRMFGPRVRFRGIEHIMREVRECMDRHGINHFTIDDDTFTLRRGRVMEFCGRMAALPATWDCDTRVDQVDRDMIRAMARSGCVKIAFGVESGSQRILDLIKKGVAVEQIRNAFAWTREAGAMSCAFLMVGSHPEETARDIRLTWKLIRDIKPDLISVMIATPYPGSELHDLMRRENLLREVPWSAYAQSFEANSFSRTKTLSAAQLKFWQNRLLAGFYLRPGYIAGRLARMDSAADLEYWARAGLGFLKHLAGK